MEGISSMLTAFKILQSLFNSVLSEDYKNEILVLGGNGRYFNREASQNADNYQKCSWKLSWKNLGWQETLLIHQDLSSTDLLNELLTELRREGRSKYKQNPCLRSGRS